MKVVVMIPTYNERANVRPLARALLGLGVSGLEVLFVDDASPDGTGRVAAELAGSDARVRLLERTGPRGRGLAGREGYLWALEAGADRVIEMDADFSHDPRSIPDLLAAAEGADLVIGSRFVSGGADDDRPWWRRGLTVLANAYARRVLGLGVRDTNSGFRCFTRRGLEAIEPRTLASSGPSIVHEALFRACRAGLRVREVPIRFVDRKEGRSKLTLGRLAAGYLWILRLRLGL